MRVTTRLMQAASWLLVQRAVHDGDMERDQARVEPLSAGLEGNLPGRCRPRMSGLAAGSVARSAGPQRKSLSPHSRLDDVLFGDGAEPLPRAAGVQAQSTGWPRPSRAD